jgi:hypothetical protein
MPSANPYCLKCFQGELWRLNVPYVEVPDMLLTEAECNQISADSVNQPMICYWCRGKTFDVIYYV